MINVFTVFDSFKLFTKDQNIMYFLNAHAIFKKS